MQHKDSHKSRYETAGMHADHLIKAENFEAGIVRLAL
jgi:hypothetical protein